MVQTVDGLGTGSFTNTTTGCYGYCMHRLPCGYCKEMKSMCPFAGSGCAKITWDGKCTGGSVTIPVNYTDKGSISVSDNIENATI